MIAWWESLTALEHLLLYIAVPATLLLVLQTVLLFVGGGPDSPDDLDGLDGPDSLDGDWDGVPDLPPDLDGDGIPDDSPAADDPASGSLHLFTLRGLVAFLTLFGWGSLWLCQLGARPWLALALGAALGLAGMAGIAILTREAVRLQCDGTLDLRNAIGLAGTVYLTVPPARSGAGKVNVLVQDQLRELDAITDSAQALPTGADIVVAGLAGRDTLLVAPAPQAPCQP